MDRWHGLTMEDIRAIEDKTKEELDKVSRLFLHLYFISSVFPATQGGKQEKHTVVWLEHPLDVDVEVILTFIAQK
jgi:hypothetical protein